MRRIAVAIYFVLLLFQCLPSSSQVCTNRYTSLIYKSISWDTFTKAMATPTGQWVVAGDIINDHGLMAKFTQKGTPLFSYQYNPVYQFNTTYFKTLRFTDIIQSKDGGFVAAGNVVIDRWIDRNEYVNKGGAVIKTDEFGHVIWSKKLQTFLGLTNSGYHLAATNITEDANGDLVVYLAADFDKYYAAHGRVICLDRNGKQKWMTILATNLYDGGFTSLQTKRAMLITINGSIVIGDVVYKTDRTTGKTLSAQLHFIGLENASGKLVWEQSYEYPLGTPETFTDFIQCTERNNGNLVFSLSAYPSGNGITGLRIETDSRGKILRSTAYQSNTNENTRLVSVVTEPGTNNQSYFFKTASHSIIATIGGSGNLVRQKGYGHEGNLYPGSCLASSAKGYGVFMSSFQSHRIRLLLTDSSGAIDCINVPADVRTEQIALTEGEPIVTVTGVTNPTGLAISDFPLKETPNPLTSTVACEETAICCNDKVDSSNLQTASICEGSTYSLPDGTTVQQSGTYFVVYKTPGGCDSIRYHRIEVDKHPAKLTLGNDVCLGGKDSLRLDATEGFTNYQWMNGSTTQSSSYTVTRPGTYWVNVRNSCGSRTDSITVFAHCEFPVYMPTAFTPNNDGNNDYFFVSPLNKNIFVSLRIFNRWGHLIFHSVNPNKGWNGKIGNVLQPMGVYVYHLEMKGLSGKKIQHTGTVLLIR